MKILKVAILWPQAVEASINKKNYAESLEILGKIPKFEKFLPKIFLLSAQNQYLLGNFLACDLALRECLKVLNENTRVKQDDSKYIRVYINSLYFLLQKKFPTSPPDFDCPLEISTKNVDSELLELFPIKS